MDKSDDLTTIIREAFRRSGRSMKSVATEAGLPYATIHGLMAGTKNITLASATRLCLVLRLQLVPIKKGRER